MSVVGGGTHSAVRVIVNRGFQSNTYLLSTGQAQDCVVIDPGLDIEAIRQEVAASGWQPIAVLCTHGHFDHIGSAARLQADYSIPVFMRQADHKTAKLANFMMKAFKIEQRIDLPDFQYVEPDDSAIECGGQSFFFHALPGHTAGSAAIEVGGLLFSGDSLYARKVALSRLPGEDHKALRASLSRLFEKVDGSVRVFPGHGGSAMLAEILRDNQELLAFMAQPDDTMTQQNSESSKT